MCTDAKSHRQPFSDAGAKALSRMVVIFLTNADRICMIFTVLHCVRRGTKLQIKCPHAIFNNIRLVIFSQFSRIGISLSARPLRFNMARNLNLFFDSNGAPRARGPSSEKILMAFLETDVQGSDHICHDLMEDLTAIEDNYADSREFVGNAHSVVMTAEGVTIECIIDDVADDEGDDNTVNNDSENSDENKNVANKVETSEKQTTSSSTNSAAEPKQYKTALKHFREVLEDWEAFILDDQSPA
jgi:hypothetical protein